AKVPFKDPTFGFSSGFPTSEEEPLPGRGKCFSGNSNPFELLKRHLAVSLRTQESVRKRIGMMNETTVACPKGQTLSLGCKITAKTHCGTVF
ncbi:MAG: hypothetical protein J6B91_06935, partial [Prevotella sp.]|nr:hypothetical protein [Prevotella sp.]